MSQLQAGNSTLHCGTLGTGLSLSHSGGEQGFGSVSSFPDDGLREIGEEPRSATREYAYEDTRGDDSLCDLSTSAILPESAHPTPQRRRTGRDSSPHIDPDVLPRMRQKTVQRERMRRRTAASLNVTSLNMKGRGFLSGSNNNKWRTLTRELQMNRIGLIALQETHLDSEMVSLLNDKLYSRNVKIFHSADPLNPTGKGGVAFVFNRKLTSTDDIEVIEVVPGRAILIRYPWHGNKLLTVLNVYAPAASPAENRDFWLELTQIWQQLHLPAPDLVMGDMNVVEDAIDRLPCKSDDVAAVAALRRFREMFALSDGWRSMNPGTLDFSYHDYSNTPSFSRLDRIYASRAFIDMSLVWSISDTALSTDHKPVSVLFSDPDAPDIGPGRWCIPKFVLENKKFILDVENAGAKIMASELWNEPQRALDELEEEIIKLARVAARSLACTAIKEVERLKKARASLMNSEDAHTDMTRREIAILDVEIKKRSLLYLESKRRSFLSRLFVHGDGINPLTSKLSAAPKEAQVFTCLNVPDSVPPRYVFRTKEMASTAREYYDGIQIVDNNVEGREQALNHVLSHVNFKLSESQVNVVCSLLTREDVEAAIRACPNNKAAGIRGIPSDLWKKLLDRFADGFSCWDVLTFLTVVFNNIELNGIMEGTKFAHGWLCPIFKKKDKRMLGNYRPITVLNATYKFFTKALTARLAKVAPSLVHPNQAGFMRGRSIFDQIWLLETLIPYAELVELNGAVVGLDQEKAYDRIQHDYLWSVLRTAGFPEAYIAKIRALYEHAFTSVAINGYLSSPFQITRGVRQGDPLSCLLFNLAIEPLACMLRDSGLKGLKLPGMVERQILSLFADDTTVFLSEDDDFEELREILQIWCCASGAKFNVQKTEIIPIGSRKYRETLIVSRRLNPRSSMFPVQMHIVVQNEPVRFLGAWQGNFDSITLSDVPNVWQITMAKVNTDLDRWSVLAPSLYMRRLIVQTVVGGRTLFLAMAQGMPQRIERELERKMMAFFWNDVEGVRGRISVDTLYEPVEKGGMNLLNLKNRNEGISFMRLKAFLNLTDSRPTWAYIADALLAASLTESDRPKWRDGIAIQNVFLQDCDLALRGKNCHLPMNLRNMLSVALKYGITFDGLAPTECVRQAMPLWYHYASNSVTGYYTREGSCMRNTHRVLTVGDAWLLARRSDNARHANRRTCICAECSADRNSGCTAPYLCVRQAMKLIMKLPLRWRPPTEMIFFKPTEEEMRANAELDFERSTLTFDPHVDLTRLTDGFRVFTKRASPTSIGLPSTKPPIYEGDHEYIVAYSDGSCLNNGSASASAGGAVWYGKSDSRNVAKRVPPSVTQSSSAGEMLAVHYVISANDLRDDILCITDSQQTISSLISWFPKWEDHGWTGVANKTLIQSVIATMRRREGRTMFKWTKGHNGIEGNEGADALAKIGAMSKCDERSIRVLPQNLLLHGARLSTLSLKMVCRSLREFIDVKERRLTHRNLLMIQDAIEDRFRIRPTTERIWKSLMSRDLSRAVRVWLWKSLHDFFWLGNKWLRIRNCEDRVQCTYCGIEDSMAHILCACEIPGQDVVWKLVRGAFERKRIEWYQPTLGLILGSSSASFAAAATRPLPGSSRLYRILMTESAHLIWTLRCVRVIEHENNRDFCLTEREIEGRWKARIDERIHLDMAMARIRAGSLTERSVLRTWSGLLEDEGSLPCNWIRQPEFLVGINVQAIGIG